MKVVVATDSYKGSLTSVEAARAMADGVLAAEPAAEVVLCPMADGGEGMVEAVAAATAAEVRELDAAGPLPGQRVQAGWAYLSGGIALPDGEAAGPVAVIEMAQASGFALVPADRRDPFTTTTLGTGELIEAALDAACRTIIVGIGGSATVDGGTGMARALGYRLLDAQGDELPLGGGSLQFLSRIDVSGRDERVREASFLVASDVDNPLLGEAGAARVFGPQKGATAAQVEQLELGLARLAEVIEADLGVDVLSLPGGGAAGGLGAGLVAFCGARITSGVQLVAALAGLREKIVGADLVLTGEGSFDSQTARGKAPMGVIALARDAGVPAVVVAGRLEGDAALGPGAAAYSVSPGPMPLEEAMRNAARLVRDGTERLLRLLAECRR